MLVLGILELDKLNRDHSRVQIQSKSFSLLKANWVILCQLDLHKSDNCRFYQQQFLYYLNDGTGYACASHKRAKLFSAIFLNQTRLASVENFGPLVPTGSTVHQNQSDRVETICQMLWKSTSWLLPLLYLGIYNNQVSNRPYLTSRGTNKMNNLLKTKSNKISNDVAQKDLEIHKFLDNKNCWINQFLEQNVSYFLSDTYFSPYKFNCFNKNLLKPWYWKCLSFTQQRKISFCNFVEPYKPRF